MAITWAKAAPIIRSKTKIVNPDFVKKVTSWDEYTSDVLLMSCLRPILRPRPRPIDRPECLAYRRRGSGLVEIHVEPYR